jgi:hypothetical protein
VGRSRHGKEKGEVEAPDLESARTEAGIKWGVKGTDVLEVRPKYRTVSDTALNGSDETLPPSTPRDAHVVRVAFAILEWSREDLRSRVSGVKRTDLENLLDGRTSGVVKAEVFRVLNESGADTEEIEQLIEHAKALVKGA